MKINLNWLKEHYKVIIAIAFMTYISITFLYFALNFGVGFGDENFYGLASETIIKNHFVIPPWMTSVYTDHAGGIGEPLSKPFLSLFIPAIFYKLGLFKAYATVFGILTVGLVFYIGNRFYGYIAGLLAAITLAGMQLFIHFTIIAYSETMTSFFILLSVYMIFSSFAKDSKKYLIITGIVLGLSFLTKEFAYMTPIMFFLYIIIQKMRGRYRKGTFKKLIIISIIGLMIASPWLARNYHYYQNPFFPQFRTIFGTKYVDPVAIQVMKDQPITPMINLVSITNLLRYFSISLYLSIVGLSFLAFRRRPIDVVIVLSSIAFSVTIFMLNVPDIRYLFSAMPFIALASGAFLSIIIEGRRMHKAVRVAGIILIIILAGFFLSTTYNESNRVAHTVRGINGYTVGAMQWVIQNTKMDDVIYDLWVHEMAFITKRPSTYSNIYSKGYELYYWWDRPVEEAAKNLAGIDYVIIDAYLFGVSKGEVWTYTPLKALQFMAANPDYFKEVYNNNGVIIFKVLRGVINEKQSTAL